MFNKKINTNTLKKHTNTQFNKKKPVEKPLKDYT